ncbi:MAG TPA: alpha-hydroxy-acid oxidizing protein [Actinomycetes bacterium]|nr:alpha-hydroxy-acid oxidizing protein [Actinomycetes bacterium]
MASLTNVGRSVQSEIYRRGALLGRRPAVPVRADRLEAAARKAMSPVAWSYIGGSAGSERTSRANVAAFDSWRLVPRMLRDVSTRELGIELFGHRYPSPLLLAPIGALELAHRRAEVAAAPAAASLGVPVVISSQGSAPMEATAAALGDGPRWFQLYWSREDVVVDSFVRRAEAIGCDALVVTVDTQVLGWRTGDLDRAYLPFIRGQGIAQYTSDPAFLDLVARRVAAQQPTGERPRPTPSAVRTLVSVARNHPGRFRDNLRDPAPRAAVETFLEVFSRLSLTWDELGWLRSRTSLPILLKGLQRREDARLALEHGVDGIVVSNHGGRQVDGAIASLDALPGIVEEVGGRVPVLFDSGVRTGSDVLKALALGARAVLLGRPWTYGLAIAGTAGVRAVLDHTLAELDLTMALCGVRSVDEIGADLLTPAGSASPDGPATSEPGRVG